MSAVEPIGNVYSDVAIAMVTIVTMLLGVYIVICGLILYNSYQWPQDVKLLSGFYCRWRHAGTFPGVHSLNQAKIRTHFFACLFSVIPEMVMSFNGTVY